MSNDIDIEMGFSIFYFVLICLMVGCRLYYAKIGIGTPSKDYYVQVDTGSDIMWVNCINCRQCPTRGYRGVCVSFSFSV